MTPLMEMPLTGLLTWASILSLTILICSLVFFPIFLRNKEKALTLVRKSLTEWKMQAESLDRKLRQAKSKIEIQRVNLKRLEGINRELKEQELSMFRKQFADISQLLEDRLLSLKCGQDDAFLSTSVDIILKRIIGGHDGLGELVNCINRQFDNVLVHLKDEIPRLANVDFRMFCYYCIGFPPKLIYELVGLNNISSLYLRKKRLSDKIVVLNSERRELYLVLLDSSSVEKHCRSS